MADPVGQGHVGGSHAKKGAGHHFTKEQKDKGREVEVEQRGGSVEKHILVLKKAAPAERRPARRKRVLTDKEYEYLMSRGPATFIDSNSLWCVVRVLNALLDYQSGGNEVKRFKLEQARSAMRCLKRDAQEAGHAPSGAAVKEGKQAAKRQKLSGAQSALASKKQTAEKEVLWGTAARPIS